MGNRITNTTFAERDVKFVWELDWVNGIMFSEESTLSR